MPDNIIELYVPCRLIEVTVSVAPTQHLSHLEALVLRAMYAGISKFRDLVEMFGLGQRPTLDLISDLWHRGYLALDMEKSELWLTDHVREALTNNKLDTLSTGEVQERKTRVAQELLSGHILRPPRRPAQVQRSRVVPVEYSGRALSTEHRQEVIGVLDQVLTSAPTFGRDVRVLAVDFGLLGLLGLTEQPPMSMSERSLMELRVECTRNSATDQLAFKILHPAALPVRMRQSMERALGKLTAQLPAHQFVRQMREHAELPSVVERLEPSVATQRLGEKCAKLPEIFAPPLRGIELYELARTTQEDLELAALPAREGAEELLLSRSQVEVLANESDFFGAIKEAINTAEKQLILCLPTLKYHALQRIQPWLEERLRIGVKVFLLWGHEPDSVLDTAVNNRLAELQHMHRQLRVSVGSARVGTTVVIKDNQLAIVACADPLVELPVGVLLLGVALRLDSASAEWEGVIAELITYCRNAFPDHRVSSYIESTWEPQRPDRTPVPLAFPLLLPASDAAWQPDRARVTLSLWREQWCLYAQQLERSLSVDTSTATLVAEDQIREVFWRLLGRKQQRLIMISERMTSEVVNSKLVQTLHERLDEGTKVAILYSEAKDAGVQARLQELADRWPTQLLLHQARPHYLRSECILSDDCALLSSLQFLAVGGDYVGTMRWRLPTHAGLLLKGSQLLGAILSSVRDHATLIATAFPPAVVGPAPTARPAAPVPHPPVPPTTLELASQLAVTAGDRIQQVIVLRDWFSGMSAPLVWAALAQLQRAGLPELWLAVSCALDIVPDNLQTAEGQKWQAWLVSYFWHEQHSPPQAWLLLHDWSATVATSDHLPSLPLVALAAVQDRPEVFSKRHAALPAALNAEESCGVAALSITAVLRSGNSSAAQWLADWQTRLPPPLSKVATAVLRFYHRTGAPYPIAAVTGQLQFLRLQKQSEETRRELATALSEGRQIKGTFPLLRLTWERLYGSSGSLGQLERIIGDNRLVQDWWQDHAKAARNIEQWIDEQSRQAAVDSGWFGNSRIDRGSRTSSLNRLRPIFQKVQRLTELDAAIFAAPRLREPSSMELAAELRRLCEPVGELATAAGTKRAPSAPLLRSLVKFLRSTTEESK